MYKSCIFQMQRHYKIFLILIKVNKSLKAKQKLTSKINGVMYFQHSLKMTFGYNPVMSLMTSHILSAPETVKEYKRSRYILR